MYDLGILICVTMKNSAFLLRDLENTLHSIVEPLTWVIWRNSEYKTTLGTGVGSGLVSKIAWCLSFDNMVLT